MVDSPKILSSEERATITLSTRTDHHITLTQNTNRKTKATDIHYFQSTGTFQKTCRRIHLSFQLMPRLRHGRYFYLARQRSDRVQEVGKSMKWQQ